MKKDKKTKKLQARDIPKFDDIQRATESDPEPPRKFEGTIQNGTRDEITEKAIAEANKE